MEFDRQVTQLADLIDEINKEQTSLDRKKLITLCTIDVHARDLVAKLIEERVEDGMCFQWQSQLRYYQNEKTKGCQVGSGRAEGGGGGGAKAPLPGYKRPPSACVGPCRHVVAHR